MSVPQCLCRKSHIELWMRTKDFYRFSNHLWLRILSKLKLVTSFVYWCGNFCAAFWYGHHHKSVWVTDTGEGGCTRSTVVSSKVSGASTRLSLAGCTLFVPSRRRALDSCVRGRWSLNTGVESNIYCCYLYLSGYHSFLFHSFADPHYRGWLFMCQLPCSQPFKLRT